MWVKWVQVESGKRQTGMCCSDRWCAKKGIGTRASWDTASLWGPFSIMDPFKAYRTLQVMKHSDSIALLDHDTLVSGGLLLYRPRIFFASLIVVGA